MSKLYIGQNNIAVPVKTAYYGINNKAVKVWESNKPVPTENIYGAEWNGTANSSWTRTDAAANFQNPVPAVNNGTGSSPFDEIMPWAGMVRSTDANAGEIVAIPKYYYKWTQDGSKLKLQVSPEMFEGARVSPAHADRGDGKGERSVIYVGRYQSVSNYKSTSGSSPLRLKKRSEYRSGIHNLGSTIWQWDYATYWTIAMLYLVEYSDWNCRKVIGNGVSNGSSPANNGYTDSMAYHTGTTASSRDNEGGIQYRNIEGLWSNIYAFVDGIYFTSSKVYSIANPANFSDSSGGTAVANRLTTTGYIGSWYQSTASGFEYLLWPNSINGSDTTYTCAHYYYESNYTCLVMGKSNDGTYSKPFGLFQYDALGTSNSGSAVGSRLMILP